MPPCPAEAVPAQRSGAGWGAILTALLIALMLVAPLAALGLRLRDPNLPAGDLATVRFTLLQAAISAGLSAILAVPVARALARRRFPGRGLVISTLGAPFLLPVIVAILGLLAVFGRAGWLNGALGAVGVPPVSIYGLHGVVLAHVFFNLPLATRMLLQGWSAIPAERFRLARSLDLPPAAIFRHLELPMLREVLPGAALVIFTLCLSSFAVALTLGGGPRATTVELAIYQALRFEFDLPAAARLSLIQFALCAAAFALATRIALPAGFGAGFDRTGGPPGPPGLRRIADAALILAACAFLALPIAAVVARGAPGLMELPAPVWSAAGRSVAVALGSAALSTVTALMLALTRARVWPGLAATLPLAASPLVLGTGLFLIVQPFVRPADLALPVTMIVNALLTVPFAYRLLAPEAVRIRQDYGRLMASLDMTARARLRIVLLPRLRPALGFATGLAAALSMGDLGVIALFADRQQATLPLLVQQLMGAYRLQQAAGAALVLVTLSFALFVAFDRWGRHADA